MEGTFLVTSLGVMIVAAAVLVLLFQRIHIPAIITYILVGLLLDPLLNWAAPLVTGMGDSTGSPAIPDTVGVIGEIGIALLLFIVGLELTLEKIRDVGRVALFAGIGQVVFTAVGGFFISLLLGFDVIESIFLATALTFSSTVVVVKLLDQKKELDSLYGRIAVGIFLVQDLVVILALTFLAGLGNPENLEPAAVTFGLVKAFVGMGILLGLALLASRYVLARPFEWAGRTPEMIFVWSLGWCLLFVLLAEVLGLSPELGAFLAGISLAQLRCSEDLRRRIHPLMNFFVAIFFISLGAQMELEAASRHWAAAGWLSLFVLIGNPLIFMWIIVRCGYGERTSFLTSVTVAQISEFSFIFAALGFSSGLIDESILSLIATVGLVTIALSSYMILYNHRLYDWSRRWGILRPFRASAGEDEEASQPLTQHVVVVGLNTMGRRIVRELAERGEEVLSIDRDPAKLASVPGKKKLGSVEYVSVTQEAHLSRAKMGVSTLRIEDANNVFAFRCKQLGIPVAVHGFDSSVLEELKRLEVDFVIDSKRFGAGEILNELEKRGILKR